MSAFQLCDFLTGYAASNAVNGAAAFFRYCGVTVFAKKFTGVNGATGRFMKMARQLFLHALLYVIH